MEQVRQDQFDGSSEKKQKSALLEILESVAIAVLLAVLIRMFLFQPFIIPSESMYPTLQISDRIMVNKLSYHLGDPSRGDVVVFKYPMDPSRDFVKRSGKSVSGKILTSPRFPCGLRILPMAIYSTSLFGKPASP